MLFFERVRAKGVPEIPGHEYPVRLKETDIPIGAINYIDLTTEERGTIWTLHLGTGLKREFYDDDNPRLLSLVTKNESPDFVSTTPFSKNAKFVCVRRVVRIDDPIEQLHQQLKDSENVFKRFIAICSLDKLIARRACGNALSLIMRTHNESGDRVLFELLVPREVAKEVYRKNPKVKLTCTL